MKLYEIMDEETDLSIGVLIYYEKARSAIIELRDYLDEWTAPLLFAGLVRKHIYTVPEDISSLWINERVIPSGRQNIGSILTQHKLKAYDEMKFLEISEGRCSQDQMYIRKIERLPDFAVMRRKQNIRECILLGGPSLLCFFEDGTVKKIKMEDLSDIEDVKKILQNEKLLESCMVGTGGYCVTFNSNIYIPADRLYDKGEKIPLTLNDFLNFVQKNTYDTAKSCDFLQCSRQNLSYLVTQKQLHPIKENQKGNLYLKGDLLKNRW